MSGLLWKETSVTLKTALPEVLNFFNSFSLFCFCGGFTYVHAPHRHVGVQPHLKGDAGRGGKNYHRSLYRV